MLNIRRNCNLKKDGELMWLTTIPKKFAVIICLEFKAKTQNKKKLLENICFLKVFDIDKRYPGHPDIVLSKYKTVVFINGCFWHMHEKCPDFVLPKLNIDYWQPKLMRNKQWDAENIQSLKPKGWTVVLKQE